MKRFGILVLIGVFFVQCNKGINSCTCKSDICTEVYITLGLKIKDQYSNPVILDSFKTIKVDNQKVLDLSFSVPEIQEGYYPFISDSHLEKNKLCSEDYVFKGWIKDSLVVEKTIPVKNNCCHVEFATPQSDIIIQL